MQVDLVRELVQTVKCPVCKARRGQQCRWRGKPRRQSHGARVEKFLACKASDVKLPTPVRRTAEEREAYRAQRRSVECPLCGAAPNERCRSRRPEGRLSNHEERNVAWARVRDGR